jgi:hypothetical protein
LDFGASATDINLKLVISGLHAPYEYLKQNNRNDPGDESFVSNASHLDDVGSEVDQLNKSMLDKLENLLDFHGPESFNAGGTDSESRRMSDSALSSAALAVAIFQSTHGHEKVQKKILSTISTKKLTSSQNHNGYSYIFILKIN